MAALGRTHTHSGEALHKLDVTITHARCVDYVVDLEVFVEIHKLPTFGVLQERPRMVDLLGTADVFSFRHITFESDSQVAQCPTCRVPSVSFY